VLRHREAALRRLPGAVSTCGSGQHPRAEIADATAGSRGDGINFDFSNFIPADSVTKTLSHASAKGRFRRFDCGPANDCSWSMSGYAAALLFFETRVGAMGLTGCHHLFQDRSLFLRPPPSQLKRPLYGAQTALRTSFLSFGHRARGHARNACPEFSGERNGRDLIMDGVGWDSSLGLHIF
jgi:hypothetical protein